MGVHEYDDAPWGGYYDYNSNGGRGDPDYACDGGGRDSGHDCGDSGEIMAMIESSSQEACGWEHFTSHLFFVMKGVRRPPSIFHYNRTQLKS